MMDWLEPIAHGDVVDWKRSLVSLLLAFGLTQAIAGVYMLTVRGLSYSRTMVQSMAMGGVVTCMLMLAVGNSVAASIGIAGGLTAVRFRTTLRDPRDILFIFASLGVGMASGLGSYSAAIVGTAIFAGASLLLHVTEYGSRRQPDGLLRFVAAIGSSTEDEIAKILREHCRTFALVTLREAAQGTVMEHAYQVSVRDPDLRPKLVKRLQDVPGIQDVSLLLQEPTLDL